MISPLASEKLIDRISLTGFYKCDIHIISSKNQFQSKSSFLEYEWLNWVNFLASFASNQQFTKPRFGATVSRLLLCYWFSCRLFDTSVSIKISTKWFSGPEVQRQQRCAALRQLPPSTNAVLSNFRADCTASSQVAASFKWFLHWSA